MESKSAQIASYNHPRRRRRWRACLLWGCGAFAGLLIAGVIAVGAVYAGWTSGLATARADATTRAEAYARQQCARIPGDLAAGNLGLAASRFDDLGRLRETPACIALLAPTATAAHLLAAASPTPPPPPPVTPTPLPPALAPTAVSTPLPTTAARVDDAAPGYDLEALLAEAQSALSLGDYPAAIDTLDAIINIDGDFQRDRVRRLFLEALTAQALALFRSGRLSEAIVMTDRAEEHGNIDDLYHERYIALLYLDGQRFKATNPGEAVRKFSSMYHQFGVRDYVNGSVATDLQEAHRNFALALALQGEHCAAQSQFEAALELRPAYSRVNLADLAARRDQSIQACREQQQAAFATAATSGEAGDSAPPEVAVGEQPTLAPVGEG